MQSVAIVGVGLIGASFGLALRKAGFPGRIWGVSSPASIDAGCQAGAIEKGVTLEEAAAEADLLYLAQPIHAIRRTLKRLGELARAGAIKENALITDAGSTKSVICAAAREHLEGVTFLGGHPMAGKEQRGAAAAEADLFAGRPYIVTPHQPQDLNHPPVAAFLNWLERLGVRLVVLTAQQHDRMVAFTSHLPQLASTALAALLGARGDWEELKGVAGPGLLDMTRLARSPYAIWQEILETNDPEILAALDAYIARLEALRASLAAGGAQDLFAQGNQAAEALWRAAGRS